jgi:hypothetical protein
MLADALVILLTGAFLTAVRIAWIELREIEFQRDTAINLQRDRIRKLKRDVREARDELSRLRRRYIQETGRRNP